MTQVIDAGRPDSLEALTGSSCAFGVFDGVHLGHKFIIDDAIERAKLASSKSAIITFDIDPDELFNPNLKKIMSNELRISYLAKMGADYLIILHFDRQFAAQSPSVFLDSLFKSNRPESIHIGCDFRFGSKASGGLGDLNAWAEKNPMEVISRDLLMDNGAYVTSSRIRDVLGDGDISYANRLLGHPYEIASDVEKGRGEGSDMGFCTANLSINAHLDVLGQGVYGGVCRVMDRAHGGHLHKCAISCGVSPTFSDLAKSNIEVHILGFEDDIYGAKLDIFFMERIRDMIKFDNVSDLISQVKRDIRYIGNDMDIPFSI